MINNDIIISSEDFNIQHVLECGQVFRFVKQSNCYTLKTLDKSCILYNKNNEVVIENEDKLYFENYFDLNTDYNLIKQQLACLPHMPEAIENGKGIRILKQDPFEAIISFIISSNNNIPRIKKIIETICSNGKFPTPAEFACFDEPFFKSCGAGYRANYLFRTAQTINSGQFDLGLINSLNTMDAIKYLCKMLIGVGAKVADCIMLFGYYRMDVFPVDTWIQKVFCEHFGTINNVTVMRAKLLEQYGNLSGYAQQYLFYNKRENS